MHPVLHGGSYLCPATTRCLRMHHAVLLPAGPACIFAMELLLCRMPCAGWQSVHQQCELSVLTRSGTSSRTQGCRMVGEVLQAQAYYFVSVDKWYQQCVHTLAGASAYHCLPGLVVQRLFPYVDNCRLIACGFVV